MNDESQLNQDSIYAGQSMNLHSLENSALVPCRDQNHNMMTYW
jgi:hypothetical protein